MTAPHVVQFPEGDIWLLCFKRPKTDHRKCQYIPESRGLTLEHPVDEEGETSDNIYLFCPSKFVSVVVQLRKSSIRTGETGQPVKCLLCKQEDVGSTPRPTFKTKQRAGHSGMRL